MHAFPPPACLFEAKLVSMNRHLEIRQKGVWIHFSMELNQECVTCHLRMRTPQSFVYVNTALMFPTSFLYRLNMFSSLYILEDLDSSFQAILYCKSLSESQKFTALVMFSFVKFNYSCYLFNSKDIVWFMRYELYCIGCLVPLSPAAVSLILPMTSNMVFVFKRKNKKNLLDELCGCQDLWILLREIYTFKVACMWLVYWKP